ncbi:MAG: helix-turn-helix transcriptional regulator [Clostridia bacterium]|nr:helix-turn-helix transcriptional regulator [Clostridia bacterium]
MSITKKIRSYIDENGIKIMAISKKTGIKYAALRSALSDERNLTIEEYVSVCNALDVPVTRFI